MIAVSASLASRRLTRVYRLASKPRRLARGATRTVTLKLSKALRGALATRSNGGGPCGRADGPRRGPAGNVTRKRASLRLVR